MEEQAKKKSSRVRHQVLLTFTDPKDEEALTTLAQQFGGSRQKALLYLLEHREKIAPIRPVEIRYAEATQADMTEYIDSLRVIRRALRADSDNLNQLARRGNVGEIGMQLRDEADALSAEMLKKIRSLHSQFRI